MENKLKVNLSRKLKIGLAIIITAQLSALLSGCNADKLVAEPNLQAMEISPNNNPSISVAKLAQIERVLKEEIDAGLRAGYAVMIAKEGKVVYKTEAGMADREKGIPITDNTRFRIASMTKAITVTAIMQLIEDGTVLLNDPVSKYIPAFADARVASSQSLDTDGNFTTEALARPITIHHLLTHTSGYAYAFFAMSDLDKKHSALNPHKTKGELAARIEQLAMAPLYEQPGEKYRYGYGIDIAGRVIEVASGKSLEGYMKEAIFEPLGMSDTEFFVDASDFERLAVTYSSDKEGRLFPTEADPFQRPANMEAQGWMSGGGGLVSTSRDYMRFLMMILNEGSFEGARVLAPASVKLMLQRSLSDQVTLPEQHPTLDPVQSPGATLALGGYVVENPGLRGLIASAGQWGWDGYYDTAFFISPAHELAVIIMTQQSPWERMPSRVKDRITAITYGAIEK